MRDEGLSIRLLGDLALCRGSQPVAFPPSKKTRALLAYLLLTGRAHRRERLCSMFWDVADDPRGALRWSLSKLRALVDEPGVKRVVADRDSVEVRVAGARVDAIEVRAELSQGAEALPTDRLASLAEVFAGELLEGFDLGDFDEFQAWCVAEREQYRRWHAATLETLLSRWKDEPERALPIARRLVHVDPLRPAPRITLMDLLLSTGRREEAEQQLRAGLRVLESSGSSAAGVLRASWAELARRPVKEAAPPIPPPEPEAAPVSLARPRLVGRQEEQEALRSLLARVADRSRGRAVLVSGEAGIGKSRLLEELASAARARGGTVFSVSAHETDSARPYGPWIDGLRQLPVAAVGDALGGTLGLLLPELGAAPAPERSRDRLFGEVLGIVSRLCESAPPVVLIFNDVQWSDESSCGLVQYVTRMSKQRALLVAMSARSGELEDNEAASALVRGLRRERQLEEIELGAMSAEETTELVAGVAAGPDAARVFAESAGNPLFALELARSGSERGEAPPRSLGHIVRDRLHRLSPDAAEVLRWASILGPLVEAQLLGGLTALQQEEVVEALEALERHSLLTHAERAGAGTHVFAHDVVRRVVYYDLSEPRRRMMHVAIARALNERGVPDEQLAAEIAHHAALGGDGVLAARSCVLAARRCLRLFAGADAARLARRGLRHTESLPDPERTRLAIELWEIATSGERPSELESTAREIEALAERADALGAVEHARLGFHIASHLRFEGGLWNDARRSSLRAELVSRDGDDRQKAVALAEAGRCLAMLERDMGRAESLLEEAGVHAARLDAPPLALGAGNAMLRLHQGQYSLAQELFQEALARARRERDRAAEFQAIEYLILLELERDQVRRAADLCSELVAIATRMREGSEEAYARALDALCRLAAASGGSDDEVSAALEELRRVDAKHRLVCVLARLANVLAASGRSEPARERAREALEIARLLDRGSEIALAHVALIRAARAEGDTAAAETQLDELKREPLMGISAHAEREIERLLNDSGS